MTMETLICSILGENLIFLLSHVPLSLSELGFRNHHCRISMRRLLRRSRPSKDATNPHFSNPRMRRNSRSSVNPLTAPLLEDSSFYYQTKILLFPSRPFSNYKMTTIPYFARNHFY